MTTQAGITEWALWVLNDTEYGDETEYLNGDIVSSWNSDREIAFCQEYIDNIIAINGTGELYQNELQMIKELELRTA